MVFAATLTHEDEVITGKQTVSYVIKFLFIHAQPASAKCSRGAAQCRYMRVIVLDSFQVFMCVCVCENVVLLTAIEAVGSSAPSGNLHYCRGYLRFFLNVKVIIFEILI